MTTKRLLPGTGVHPLCGGLFLFFLLFAYSNLLSADESYPVRSGAEVQTLATGFKFVEGPAYGPDGKLYFSDIPNSRIHTWCPSQGISVFLEPSGRSNGLIFDSKGRLVICQGGARQVSRLEPDGTLTILADRFQGKKLNSPNDLWIHPKGWIFFTDPRYGNRDDMEMTTEGVYLLHPEEGLLLRLVDNMTRPNGIVGTPDASILYITDAGDQKTYRFPLKPDGSLGPAKWTIPRKSDGMVLDEDENLYITDGVVAVYRPDGTLIREIEFPEKPANVTFGGPENRTLFVTARTGLYSLEMSVRGAHSMVAKPVEND
jgi:gluconolactonase